MNGNAFGRGSRRFPWLISRYVLGEFFRVFALCLVGFVLVYLLVDFFDRFSNLVKHDATAGEVIRYFSFKIPVVITQVLPVAVLAATLLSLGGLSRHSEITAMYAGGISRLHLVAPLAVVCTALGFACLVWNETVVPRFDRLQRSVYNVEIRGRQLPMLFGSTELWSHAPSSFVHVRVFDSRREALIGLTVYRVDGEFDLEGVAEIPEVRWTGSEWLHDGGVTRAFHDDGSVGVTNLPAGVLDFGETPDDLNVARRHAEEYSFFELRSLIHSLRDKGLDPTEYVVDLHLKVAVPFICVVMAILAIPFGVRNLRSSSLAANVGLGLVIGFSYWFFLALNVSLGHSGALPAIVAAWAANATFAAVGVFLMATVR